MATTGQASGTNYTSGGNNLTRVDPTSSGTTGFTDFADLTFGTATVTARGCMIYNSSDSNKSVATIDFGGDKTSTAGDFTVVFPAAAASTAIIRIA
jgi:VCBS repeat-containing protein